jgi:aspartyl-tRNA synthetase
MYRTHTCDELTEAHVGVRATLAGWSTRSATTAASSFLDLRTTTASPRWFFHDDALHAGDQP